MPIYGSFHEEKRKAGDLQGIQKEAQRTTKEFKNDVNLELSKNNVELVHSDNFLKDARSEIKRRGITERKNSVLAIDNVFYASPEWFKNHDKEEQLKFFKDCVRFQEKNFGIVISAIVHYDEIEHGSPHLHCISIPITEDNRLSARDIIGGKGQMAQRQTDFYEQVGKQYGMERGEPGTPGQRRKHREAIDYKIEKAQEKLDDLESQVEYAETIINKKEESESELNQLRRQLGEARKKIEKLNNKSKSLTTQIRKNLEEKKELTKENAVLRKDNTKLKEENKELKQVLNSMKHIKDVLDDLREAEIITDKDLKAYDYEPELEL